MWTGHQSSKRASIDVTNNVIFSRVKQTTPSRTTTCHKGFQVVMTFELLLEHQKHQDLMWNSKQNSHSWSSLFMFAPVSVSRFDFVRTEWENQPVCMQVYGSGCLLRLSILLRQSFAGRFQLRGRICYAGCYHWKRLRDHYFVVGFGGETSDEWEADGCVRHFTQHTIRTQTRWQ